MTMSARQAADHASAIVRKSGTSFYWAMRILDLEKRHAMYGLYAFCRDVDDIVDEPGEIEQKLRRLDLWRTEIDNLFNGEPTMTLGFALRNPVEKFQLQHEDFRSVIDGMASDAAPGVRIADLAELELYMDRVACAVGRLSTRIFGIEEPHGRAVSKALGEALQLTNILRDVCEDAQANRLYLPADLLAENDLVCGEHDDVPAILNNPAVEKVCGILQGIAEHRFAEADAILSQCNRGQARPAVVMMVMYHRLFKKLKARGWQFSQSTQSRLSLSKPEKLWLLLRYGLL